MIRFRSLVFVALATMLCGTAARAQISAAELITRIDRLEAAIRGLTGAVEQLQYRNQQLEQQLQRLHDEALARGEEPAGKSTPRAPAAMAPPRPTAQYTPPPSAPVTPPGPVIAAAPPPGPVIAAVPPPAPIEPMPPQRGRGDAFDPAVSPSAPGVPRPLGSVPPGAEPPPPIAEAPPARAPGAPLNLSTLSTHQGAPPSGEVPSPPPGGELPAPPPSNLSATGAAPPTLPPTNSPKDTYDLGYGYIQRKDYPLAQEVFRDFLRRYPSDRQAPEAQYWLGEALFRTQHYRDAAEAFLAVSTKYDTTARAPDALLRLGMSLAALGEKEAACASLGEVLRKYPRAALSVRQGVDREQKRAHC